MEEIEFDTQILGVPEESLPHISLEGSEIVRRQYLSHMKENSVTIRPDGIQFNNSCILRMKDTTHIHLIMNRQEQWLIIRSCDEDDRDGQRWCIVKDDGKRKSRKITGSDYSRRVYKMMGWTPGYYFKICGTPALQADKLDTLLLVFDLKEAEKYPMTAKSREAAGVIDDEITTAELEELNRIERENRKEKEERAAAALTGEKVKRNRKRNRFPEVWGEDSFGTPVEEHKSKVMIPHLPENIAEAEQMVLDFLEQDKESK